MNRQTPKRNKMVRLSGEVASRGLAAGPLHRLAPASRETATRAASNPDDEADRLRTSVAAASGDVAALLTRVEDDEAAGILEFQIAMLEDDEFTGPALSAVAGGAPAPEAWQTHLDDCIADYKSAEDAYFRARAADLRDLRDRVLRHLGGEGGIAIPPGSILLADDLVPSLFLETDWSGGGIVLSGGSAAGHVAILARARGIPMLIGVDGATPLSGTEAILDAETGVLTIDPTPEDRLSFEERVRDADAEATRYAAFRDRPAVTADGEPVQVMINIAADGELDTLDPAHCDGIGLVRTEFLFDRGVPGEDRQYSVYRRIVEWAGGLPVTLRMLDAGGDKPVPGMTIGQESNPFLGVRGLRLLLRYPDVLRTQLNAMLRAAAHGPVKIMFPMITIADEMDEARRQVEAARAELAGRDVPAGPAAVGMMVEVPAAAVTIDSFDADFFSIGSNDLVQYVMACGRDNRSLGHLARADAPAVLKLIEQVVQHGDRAGREVSLCGDAGSDPDLVGTLLSLGLRTISVAPAALGRVKAAIAGHRNKRR